MAVLPQCAMCSYNPDVCESALNVLDKEVLRKAKMLTSMTCLPWKFSLYFTNIFFFYLPVSHLALKLLCLGQYSIKQQGIC